MLLLLTATSAFAGSATQNLNTTSGDWNTDTNWMPNTVPNGRPILQPSVSNSTAISAGQIEINSIVFSLGASAYTITSSFLENDLAISGAGIINDLTRSACV